MNGYFAGMADKLIGERAPRKPPEARGLRLSNDDLRNVFARGQTKDLGWKITRGDLGGLAAEPFCEPQCFLYALLSRGVLIFRAGPGHVNREPRRVETGGKPARVAYEMVRAFVPADAHEQPFRRAPGPFNGFDADEIRHLIVDAVSSAAQGQFAQGSQVGRREEVLRRTPRRLGNIDLAFVEARKQLVRSDVDKDHVVGQLQHLVWHRFAYGDAGDPRHDIGQAFQMLDVERRPDMDTRIEQLFRILPALRMPAFGRIAMGEFVEDQEFGTAHQSPIQIELLQLASAIFEQTARQHLQPLQEARRLAAPMRLDKADHHIDAFVRQTPRALQHGEGLADARCRAEKDLEASASLPGRQR